ncbi:hypothetical protein ABIE18_003565 [Arthrobacter sp. 2762]
MEGLGAGGFVTTFAALAPCLQLNNVVFGQIPMQPGQETTVKLPTNLTSPRTTKHAPTAR